MTIPAGYIPHNGRDCPVDPEAFVDCIIRTAEGLGRSGIMRANLHGWPNAAHPASGIGAIVAYRTARRDEQVDIHERWPEKPVKPTKAKRK